MSTMTSQHRNGYASNRDAIEAARRGSGRFGEFSRAEPDVEGIHLVGGDTDGELDDAALLEVTRNMGRIEFNRQTFGRRLDGVSGSVDGEDLGQEVAYQILLGRRRRAQQVDGAKVSDAAEAIDVSTNRWVNEGGLARTIARRSADAVIHGDTNRRNTAARVALRQWRIRYEEQNGRWPDEVESDREAERIRMRFPAGARPDEGFHVAQFEMHDTHLAHMSHPGADTSLLERSTTVTPGSVIDEAYEAVESKGKAASVKARRMAWDAVAEGLGAPASVPESLSNQRATALRHEAAEAGGVSRLVSAWQDRCDEEAGKVLFAPFGDLDDTGRDQVCELMGTYRAYADDLWDAAVSRATRTRTRNR